MAKKAIKTSKKAVKKSVKKATTVKAAGKPATKVPPKAAPKIPVAKAVPIISVTRGLVRGGAAPPPEKTTLDTLYIVNESDTPVTLEVNAGAQGQTSNMTITLDNATIVKELAGDFAEKALGTNKQLNGKKLSIVATIADTSKETNLTSLTIRLKGGVSANDFPLSKTVNEEGDSEDYLCIIEFFNPLLL
jgi:hypothetical protein